VGPYGLIANLLAAAEEFGRRRGSASLAGEHILDLARPHCDAEPASAIQLARIFGEQLQHQGFVTLRIELVELLIDHLRSQAEGHKELWA
jgi:hypothetical protein